MAVKQRPSGLIASLVYHFKTNVPILLGSQQSLHPSSNLIKQTTSEPNFVYGVQIFKLHCTPDASHFPHRCTADLPGFM